MAINNVLAGVAVVDFARSLAWYEQLFDRAPDSRPMDGLAEWRADGGGWLQLFSDAARAGSSAFTLAVSDLEEHLEPLREKGVPILSTTASEVVKTATIADPDGNQIVLAEALSDSIAR